MGGNGGKRRRLRERNRLPEHRVQAYTELRTQDLRPDLSLAEEIREKVNRLRREAEDSTRQDPGKGASIED